MGLKNTIFGRVKGDLALIPIFSSRNASFSVSTRQGGLYVRRGDGSDVFAVQPSTNQDYTLTTPSENKIVFNYGSLFTGDISLMVVRDLKDVYSVKFGTFHNGSEPTASQISKFNVLNIEKFFAQFPNLYSIYFDEYAYQSSSRMSIFKGDFSRLPDSVERVYFRAFEVYRAAIDSVMNLSNYRPTSLLKYFNFSGEGYGYTGTTNIFLTGDLSKLPPLCNFFHIVRCGSGSAITYTAGKVWPSNFDTLKLPIALTNSQNDSLLIDMANSISIAIGGKVINLKGNRTALSDWAVSYLQNLGFMVTINRI